MNMSSQVVLGLDLGIGSVGWALVRRESGESTGILGLGVRVFDEGVTGLGKGDDEKSHASSRREKRLARRNLDRRARRLNRVYSLLAKAGLLPVLPENQKKTPSGKGSARERQLALDNLKRARHEVLQTLELGRKDPVSGKRPGKTDKNCLVGKFWKPDLPVERFLPYFLRAKAISQPLELYEIGRAIYGLAQRRGVWWNRADQSGQEEREVTADADNEVETKSARKRKPASEKDDEAKSESGKVKVAVASQTKKLEEYGKAIGLKSAATLGQYYFALLTKDERAIEIDQADKKADKSADQTVRVRNRPKIYDRCTTREMVKAEFNAIWEAQLRLHAGNQSVLSVLNQSVQSPAKKAVYRRNKKGEQILRDEQPIKLRDEKPAQEVPLREALFKAIFFQRKLKNASHLIGACELENPNKHQRTCDANGNEISRKNPPKNPRKRAPAGHPWASKFKMLKMVNETRVFVRSTDRGYIPLEMSGESSSPDRPLNEGFLPEDMRQKLVNLLSVQQSLSWNVARTELGLDANTAFNFELQTRTKSVKGGRNRKEKGTQAPAHKAFIGDTTATKMTAIFGEERWRRMNEECGVSGMKQAEEVFWEWYACQDTDALAFIGAVRWGLPGLRVENPDGLSQDRILEECRQLVKLAQEERKKKPSQPGLSGFQRAKQRFGRITVEDKAGEFGRLVLAKEYARYSTTALKRLLFDRSWGMERGFTEGRARDMLYVSVTSRVVEGKTPQLEPLNKVFPIINNPVVKRTLTELRKVVNEIIKRKLGGTLPDLIRVEMTRELITNREGREAIQLRNDLNRRANENAAVLLGYSKENANQVSSERKRKVQLAQECGWHCPYCGQGFNVADLGNMEIEHIIPFAIRPDNSFANLTLAHPQCNVLKGGRTPFQAREDLGKKKPWALILRHVASFKRVEDYADKTESARWEPPTFQDGNQPQDDQPVQSKKKGKKPNAANAKEGEWAGRGHPKSRLFAMDDAGLEKLKREFTNADLTHTGYITKVALGYLATLYGLSPDKPSETPPGRSRQVLQVSNGAITAMLRDELGEMACKARKRRNKETGADEIVDGWISVNHVLKDGGSREPGDALNPLSAERRKKERDDHRHHAVDAVLVALADPETKLSARLEKAFADSRPQERGRNRFSWGRVHKEVLPRWPSFYRDLYDAVHVTDHFNHGQKGIVVSHRVDRKVTGALHHETFRPFDTYTQLRPGAGQIVVMTKKVSVIEIGKGDRKRLAMPGENHHVAVFQDSEEKWAVHVVSFFEVAQRVRCGKAVIQHVHPQHPGMQFRFALGKQDGLKMGNGLLRRVTKFSANGRIKHLANADARLDGDIPYDEGPEDVANTLFGNLGAQKVIITPLGEVRPVND